MRIYVAGKWEEKARVNEVQEQLRRAGHVITYDWTAQEDRRYTPYELQELAFKDFDGVRTADAVVAVMEKELPYKGTFVEIGIALGVGIPVYRIGQAASSCIFFHLNQVRHGIDELLIVPTAPAVVK